MKDLYPQKTENALNTANHVDEIRERMYVTYVYIISQ